MPWKNGRGITREIYRAEHLGAPTWRLSLAEVTSDGPFSRFPGFERILTVVKGGGMRLVGPGVELEAKRFCPVRFSGDVELTGYCHSARIENFNLIYDPSHVSAEVRMLSDPASSELTCNAGMTLAVHVLRGSIKASNGATLNMGDTGILTSEELLTPNAAGLLCAVVQLTSRA